MDKKISVERNDERGAVMLLLAVALVGLIGVASLAVDIGMALVTKSELQNVADAATLAGARELAEVYKKNPDCISKDLDDCPGGAVSKVRNKAKEYAELNKAGGVSIVVDDSDVCLGHYSPDGGAITCPDLNKVRLAQITARRDGTSNGVLPTQLATVLGINSMAVRTTTAAALTPLGKLNYAKGDFPIGISRDWFDTRSCGTGDKLVLLPTRDADSCAAWHTFDKKPASATRLAQILRGMTASPPTFEAPETIAGATRYQFIEGTVESRCSELKALYEAKRVGKIMTANIPVYDRPCGPVNQDQLIIGFVRAEISGITCAPTNPTRLEVTVECGIVGEEIGEGGGANDFGFLSNVPSMVY